MPWVWSDELTQRLEADERRGWVPLVAYRIGRDEDLDRLARTIVAVEGASDRVEDKPT